MREVLYRFGVLVVRLDRRLGSGSRLSRTCGILLQFLGWLAGAQVTACVASYSYDAAKLSEDQRMALDEHLRQLCIRVQNKLNERGIDAWTRKTNYDAQLASQLERLKAYYPSGPTSGPSELTVWEVHTNWIQYPSGWQLAREIEQQEKSSST